MKPVKVSVLDIRSVPTHEKHLSIFRAFDDLAAGESFQLFDDHDPIALHRRCKTERPGECEWEYVEKGPPIWRVNIIRRTGAHLR